MNQQKQADKRMNQHKQADKRMNQHKQELINALSQGEKVLIGIGGEWNMAEDGRDIRQRRLSDPAQSGLKAAYHSLYELVKEKDYYIVTTVTDGAVYDTEFDKDRITAPCGNVHWRQCPVPCTKDIWEEGEATGDVCPHCGAPLTGNTREADHYIEEGYLPRWEAYKKWQAETLNHRLVILELGEGLKTPTVIRWPFEKITYFNQKSRLFRIHQSLYQIPGEVGERALGIRCNSVDFIRS